MTDTLLTTDLPLPGRRQGKVRDVYDATTTAGEPALLIVQTDRISAFDVVMPNPIPGKGKVLTQLSKFWFDMIGEKLGDQLDHHLLSTDPADVQGLGDADIARLQGRVMIGRKAQVVPVECIVRGYLAGSGWSEYQKHGTVCSVALPAGLKQCAKLPEPIFTPSTKAAQGHDQNITFGEACEAVGRELMQTLRDLSLAVYRMGHDYAIERGIILADTKFEFGLPLDGNAKRPILIDEAMTPDSSRFWPADTYEIGHDQPSFDKQYVRNYLQALVDADRWHKEPPAPPLPDEIVANTQRKYLDAYQRLTGRALNL
ncbi:MAG: phosphoribosylaminoimidazolesuccinocarboxamide synthase [Phycisphaeraceae bacterium]